MPTFNVLPFGPVSVYLPAGDESGAAFMRTPPTVDDPLSNEVAYLAQSEAEGFLADCGLVPELALVCEYEDGSAMIPLRRALVAS